MSISCLLLSPKDSPGMVSVTRLSLKEEIATLILPELLILSIVARWLQVVQDLHNLMLLNIPVPWIAEEQRLIEREMEELCIMSTQVVHKPIELHCKRLDSMGRKARHSLLRLEIPQVPSMRHLLQGEEMDLRTSKKLCSLQGSFTQRERLAIAPAFLSEETAEVASLGVTLKSTRGNISRMIPFKALSPSPSSFKVLLRMKSRRRSSRLSMRILQLSMTQSSCRVNLLTRSLTAIFLGLLSRVLWSRPDSPILTHSHPWYLSSVTMI